VSGTRKNLVPSGKSERGGASAPHWNSTYTSPAMVLFTTCVCVCVGGGGGARQSMHTRDSQKKRSRKGISGYPQARK
jgi:hypothetical protein